MARYLSTLIFLLTFSSFTQSAIGESEQIVTINFRVFGVGNDDFSQLYAYDGSDYKLLEFKRTSRSIHTYIYKGPPRLSIFVNITGSTLYGKIGVEQLRLPLGNSEPINYSNFSGKENGLPVTFAVQSNRGPQLVMSNNIRLAVNRRCILILQPPKRKNSTRIEMRMLTQAVYADPSEDE